MALYICLGIIFIVDLFMYNQGKYDEDENRLRSISLLTTVNLSPIMCHLDDRKILYKDHIITGTGLKYSESTGSCVTKSLVSAFLILIPSIFLMVYIIH